MSISHMKSELHARLWAAQERWFDIRKEGTGKHALKKKGLREHADMYHETRRILFTGATRVTYERELKRFVEYAHDVRGRRENAAIDKRDFRSYWEHRLTAGDSAKELNKLRSAVVKFAALYGKYQSFHALSRKLGASVRELTRAGVLDAPARPKVTAEIRDAVLLELEKRDREAERRSGVPRAFHLALRLQKEASLRSIEATERFGPACLVGVEGETGRIEVLGKGGRHREAEISRDLFEKLQHHFERVPVGPLSPLRAYQQAVRRATLAVGGRSTGTHAHRRTSATEFKNRLYHDHLREGLSPPKARVLAVEETVEHLGHSRTRTDTASAYLSTGGGDHEH